MSQDLYPAGTHRCFACIQWDGRRSYESERRVIKTDAGSEGRCRLRHATTKGSGSCPEFYALR